MTAPTCLLDTGILSAIMRNNPAVMERARTYLTTYEQFTFSLITRYEILRGLSAKNATVILIATTALINDYTVVTNNTRHFDRIDELRVENWLSGDT